jgi:chromosome segregation ATPase
MPNKWLSFVKQYREKYPELTYQQCLSEARKEYTPVSIDKKQTRVDNMKNKVQATREKVSDKKTKVQLRTLKAELAELQDDESEIEESETLSKDEKTELKAVKRRINTVMKKIQDIEGDSSEVIENDSVDVISQVKLKKKSADVPIHGGSYGLSVMAPRISGMGKMSVYG